MLYYANPYAHGDDPVVLPALQAKGYDVTRLHDVAEFERLLSTTKYPLAIAFNNYRYAYELNETLPALSAHLAAGRVAWLVDRARNPSLAAPFQGGFTGDGDFMPVII